MSSESAGSVTHWLSLLREGEADAAEFIWERYFARVLQLAHYQLQGLPDRTNHAEDVALSTLNALCQAVQHGRLDNVLDRHGLWRVLLTCTLNRARNLRSAELRFKRGGTDSSTLRATDPHRLAIATDHEPSPAEAAELADELRYLMERLDRADPSHSLKQVALLKLEGYTIVEIARLQNCARKTVVVRLSVIRALWRKALLS